MIFTETDKYVDAVMVAIDMVAGMGFFVPTDNALDSVFAELDALDARNVLNEILSNPDVGMAFPWYEDRFARIKSYRWDVKNGMVTFNGHSFRMEDAAKKHEKSLLYHFGDMEKVRCYFSSIYTLAGLIMQKVGDVETLMGLLNEKHLSNKEASNPPQTRIVNADGLKEYFKLSFRGGGHGNIDYFTDYLLADLKVNRSDKDFAKIALLIHNSDKLISAMRPNTFKEWYKKFCELVGCGFHEEYKPNKLESDEDFRRKFAYL